MPETGRLLTGFLHSTGQNSFFQLSQVTKLPWMQQDPLSGAEYSQWETQTSQLEPPARTGTEFPSRNSPLKIQISIYCRASSGWPDLQTQTKQPAMPPQAGDSSMSHKHPADGRFPQWVARMLHRMNPHKRTFFLAKQLR